MDNSSQFDQFVSEIRLTDRQREACITAHKEVREKLASDSEMGKTVVSTFLQGSYIRHTIIKPSGDRHVDVDVVVVTKLSRDEYTPSQAINQFNSFLEANYRGRYRIQGRSIGISFPTVDLDLVITAAPSESVIGLLKSEISLKVANEEDYMVGSKLFNRGKPVAGVLWPVSHRGGRSGGGRRGSSNTRGRARGRDGRGSSPTSSGTGGSD